MNTHSYTLKASVQNACVAFGLLFTAACAASSVVAPPVVVHTSQGEVRAYSEESAQRVAELLEDLAPKVRATLAETCEGVPRVFVLDEVTPREFAPQNWAACNYGRLILMGPDSRASEAPSLAHELVHWQVAGAWKALPPTIEEGLADLIATELVPDAAPSRGLSSLIVLCKSEAGDPIHLLNVTRQELSDMAAGDEQSAIYAVGFVIAVRIGVQGLHDMCVQARLEGHDQVPAEWFLARARLPATDVGDWKLVTQWSFPPKSKLSVWTQDEWRKRYPPSDRAKD